MREITLARVVGQLVARSAGEPSGRPAVLLVHPINLRGASWSVVTEELAQSRVVIIPDLRGHGDSAPADNYSLDGWVEDCIAAVDAFGVDQFHVIGGSLGGSIAVRLAKLYPERVLSTMSVGSRLNSDNPDSAEVLSLLGRMSVPEMFAKVIPKHSLGPAVTPEIISETLSATNPNNSENVLRVWRAAGLADVREDARGAAWPALVVTGEFDATCTPIEGAAMAAALGVDHLIMPGIGHLPMHEDPHALLALIHAHLDAIDAVAITRAAE